MQKSIRKSIRAATPVISLKDGTTIIIQKRCFKAISPSGVPLYFRIDDLKSYLELNRNLILQ